MKVRLGINPLTWSNDDLPSLGAENSLETVSYTHLTLPTIYSV